MASSNGSVLHTGFQTREARCAVLSSGSELLNLFLEKIVGGVEEFKFLLKRLRFYTKIYISNSEKHTEIRYMLSWEQIAGPNNNRIAQRHRNSSEKRNGRPPPFNRLQPFCWELAPSTALHFDRSVHVAHVQNTVMVFLRCSHHKNSINFGF